MHEKTDQHSDRKTSKQKSKDIKPERPEELDKEHGEEVQTPGRESKLATGGQNEKQGAIPRPLIP
jgi:hypothetical protein